MITDSTATDTVANIVSDAAPAPQAVVAQPVSRFEEQLKRKDAVYTFYGKTLNK